MAPVQGVDGQVKPSQTTHELSRNFQKASGMKHPFLGRVVSQFPTRGFRHIETKHHLIMILIHGGGGLILVLQVA